MGLLMRIERYLRRSGMPGTRFGKLVANDPRLVTDLRNGREPRPAMASRIATFLDRAGA